MTFIKKKMSSNIFSRKLIRLLLIIIGTISVFFGVIGIFLPLIPTTPFLLLAAFCYAKSSDRFYTWLITNRFFGDYIRNYRERLGVKLAHKLFTILLLWLTIGYSALIIITNKWIKFTLLVIAIAVTIHLIRLKTYRSPGKDNK